MNFVEFRRLVDAMGLTPQATEELDRWGHESAPRLKKALLELYSTIADNAELSAYFADMDQLAHVRQKQYEHWRSLLSGLFDETYLESAKRVGTVHCSIGLKPQAFLTGYASILSKLLRDASQSGGQNRTGRDAAKSSDIVIDALTRAALLDIGVALTSYAEAEQSKARLSRLKFANSFRQTFAQSMTELDRAVDRLNQAASAPASPVQATASCDSAARAMTGPAEASPDQASHDARPAQSVASSTAIVRSQLEELKSKMNEFLTAACEA